MGTVFRINGIRVWVIGGDHLPKHVHCAGGGAFIRYDLEKRDWMDDQTAFSRKALELLEEQILLAYDDCIEEWEKCNGKKED